MILFEKDFNEQQAIIHYTTSNISFLKMSLLLRKMGIKNNKFILALVNADLMHVDAHSPNLTVEQQLMIALECKINPWYFFREVCRIPMHGSATAGPFELNRGNMAQIWCHLNSINQYSTQPRQTGKTTGALSLVALMTYVMGDHITIGLFAKDSVLTSQNVKRIKEIRDSLPPYMFIPGTSANSDNQETISYKPNSNTCLAYVANKDKKQADKHGRGDTLVTIHNDEFAYSDNNKISYEASASSMDAAADSAKKLGLPCSIMITTTPGYTSTEAGKYAFDFKNKCLRFEEKLYDLKDNTELRDIVFNNSANRFLYLEFNYKQLGHDDAWLKDKTAGKSLEAIQKEYLNMWIQGSGESVIPKAMMDKIVEHVMEPISVTIEYGIVMKWYVSQDVLRSSDVTSIPFIIGSDISDNAGKDFSTIVIVNPIDMTVVMTCRCNQANKVLLVDILMNLLKRFPRSVFIPERNSAATLLDMLLYRIEKETSWNPFTRIFNKFINDRGGEGLKTHDLTLGSVRSQFGYRTTGSKDSRPFLYGSVLTTVIERNFNKIFDKTITEELSGLIVRNGRIDHSIIGNDDTLIAYLIACWFIMFGQNVGLYGIRPGEILPQGAGSDSDNASNIELTNRINYLQGQLKSSSTSSIMRRAFESELRDLMPIAESKKCLNNDVISMHQTTGVVNKVSPAKNEGALRSALAKIFS